MVNSITFLKSYLTEHPNATLQEYIDCLEKCWNEEDEKMEQQEQWYKDQVGGYFFVAFNELNRKYFHIKKINDYNQYVVDAYDVMLSEKEFSISYTVSEIINMEWVNNPYVNNTNIKNKAIKITESEYMNVANYVYNCKACNEQIFKIR